MKRIEQEFDNQRQAPKARPSFSLTQNAEDGAGKMAGDLLSVPNTTKKSFKNFQLHIEFKTPFEPFAGGRGGDSSGVYVCGREVQVLDSFGLKGTRTSARPSTTSLLPASTCASRR